MKIIALEDDLKQAQQMSDYLEQYRQEHADFSYVLETYHRAFDLLDHYHGDAELLFLDSWQSSKLLTFSPLISAASEPN